MRTMTDVYGSREAFYNKTWIIYEQEKCYITGLMFDLIKKQTTCKMLLLLACWLFLGLALLALSVLQDSSAGVSNSFQFMGHMQPFDLKRVQPVKPSHNNL